MGSTVKLTMTHDDFDEESEVLKGMSNGWPAILSSLKSVLAAGRPIAFR